MAGMVAGRTTITRALAVLAIVLGVASGAAAQTTPAPGTAPRTAILDAVRRAVEAEVGAPVEFVVDQFNVLGEWAFVIAAPQRPGGGPIAYVHTRYQEAVDQGAFSGQAYALLRGTPSGWLVYGYNLGATDAVWFDWMALYPAPPEVFEIR